MPSTTSLHQYYLSQCLELARQSPPKPTNFRVGALLLIRRGGGQYHDQPGASPPSDDVVISTGYTLELPGNTHAEQCCLKKLASKHDVFEEQVGRAILQECESGSLAGQQPQQVVMYVTMEPCGKRLSGNTPCVERIIQTHRTEGGIEGRGIDRVYFGVEEPATFVGESQGCKMLDAAGVKWEHVEGMGHEILRVAKEGHEQTGEDGQTEPSSVDSISEEAREREEQAPRNPKKRMMEA